jgi:hypothetical protein
VEGRWGKEGKEGSLVLEIIWWEIVSHIIKQEKKEKKKEAIAHLDLGWDCVCYTTTCAKCTVYCSLAIFLSHSSCS